ncbi:MAG: hypothetical protein GEU75_16645 [Dehalococcoidia bacterium]|nr:hypothetical protein [Dehalococcoidia bacterium]
MAPIFINANTDSSDDSSWPSREAVSADTIRGRCLSCGLLGKRPFAIETQQGAAEAKFILDTPVSEVSPYERRSGRLSVIFGQRFIAGMPICFRGLSVGGHASTTPETMEAENRAAFQEAKGCDGWVQYRQYLSPQWHLENDEMQRLEAASRRRDRNANFVLGGLALAGLILAGVQAWTQIDPGVQDVRIVTPQQSVPSTATPEPLRDE